MKPTTHSGSGIRTRDLRALSPASGCSLRRRQPPCRCRTAGWAVGVAEQQGPEAGLDIVDRLSGVPLPALDAGRVASPLWSNGRGPRGLQACAGAGQRRRRAGACSSGGWRSSGPATDPTPARTCNRRSCGTACSGFTLSGFGIRASATQPLGASRASPRQSTTRPWPQTRTFSSSSISETLSRAWWRGFAAVFQSGSPPKMSYRKR